MLAPAAHVAAQNRTVRNGLYMHQALGTLVFEFDARRNVPLDSAAVNTASSWTGIEAAGLVVTSTANPVTYASDPPYDNGLPAIKTSNAGAAGLRVHPSGGTLVASGSRPWLGVVARLSTLGAGTRWIVRMTDNPVVNNVFALREISGTTLAADFGGGQATFGFTDTAAIHFFETWADSSGVLQLAIDGAVVATNGTGLTAAVNAVSLGIGGNTSGGGQQDASIYWTGLRATAPDATQRADAYAIARQVWNF